MQFERGVVLAHEMGLGKTTTMVMGSQALKASGQISKPFAVVQQGLARQWLDEAQLLYPNADIRLITSQDLEGENRRPVLEWLRANTPDLVIFTEPAFQSIRMSPEEQELYLFRELESLKEQLERERGVPHNAFALMKIEQRLATVEARIRRADAPMRTPGEVYWNDLGFDYGLIDEAHRSTAIGYRSKEAGGETASVRGVDLHQKLNWHHRMAELDGGRPTVTLGTGTPIENSIFEQYSVLELACPWLLDEFGVHGPDLWAETFGQKVQRVEMAPDGSGLIFVERFSRFLAKYTMKTMWGLAADTKTGDDVGIQRPKLAGGAPELVLIEPTADQRSRLLSLVVRGEAIHAGDVTRDEDNMLAVTTEGRAVALDPRLWDTNAPAANKLVTAADIIAAGYHAHKDHSYAVSSRDDTPHPVPGGLFFVFCNSGTPGGKNKGNFKLYAELRDLLAARGVPRELVQFAQDHHTPEQKAAMTDAANNGGIAVLMGSTEVLGTGFNGQNRGYALMHLDQDWTPAMMMQRNARVIRPGNQHDEVSIYFLATKGSMDAWQVGLLTSKAEGLRDIQRPPGVGDDDNDTVEEIGASDWDYATMAAEIADNPFMKQFEEAKLHLRGLEGDRRNAAADRIRLAELLLTTQAELASTQRAVAARDAALPKITATIRGDAFRMRVGGRDLDQRGEAGPVLRQAVTDVLRSHSTLGMGPWTTIGSFGGLDFAVRPEILDGGAEIRAHVGFPNLQRSESVCSVGDLANPRFGGTIIGRLATALEKAEDQQLVDHERLPVLEAAVTMYAAQQAAVDYGPAIEHARRRVELLDAVVGAITELDKQPELTESMLDPEKYRTPDSRQKAIQERAEQRAPHQAKVDQAAAALAAYDQTTPAPQLPTVPTPAPAPEAMAGGPVDRFGDQAATGHSAPQTSPGPADDRDEETAEQATEPDGDGYGTGDLFSEFGLTPPGRIPAPDPQEDPGPEPAPDSEGVPEGQMTVEEEQPATASATADTAAAPEPEQPASSSETPVAGAASSTSAGNGDAPAPSAEDTPAPDTEQQLDLFGTEPGTAQKNAGDDPPAAPAPTEAKAEPDAAEPVETAAPADTQVREDAPAPGSDPEEPQQEAVLAMPAESAADASAQPMPDSAPEPVRGPAPRGERPVAPPQTEPSVPRPDAAAEAAAPAPLTPEVPAMATPTEQPNSPTRKPARPGMPLWPAGDAGEGAAFDPVAVAQQIIAADPPVSPKRTDRSPDPVDAYWAEFEEAMAAWDEYVFDTPAAEVRAAVADDVEVLRQAGTAAAAPYEPDAAAAPPGSATPSAPPAAPAPSPASPAAVADAAQAVEAAATAAESHSPTLQDHPEWQKIKTIGGALRNVWEVMKEKAGPAWDRFHADARFQGFWRTASIRACEAISAGAAALAKRLNPALPTADALLKLSDATITYSTVATAAATPKAPPAAAPAAEAPPMQRLVQRPTPQAYATRDDALRAAQEVTARFQQWIQSPMGQEVADSPHPRVAAFRDAWRSLPPAGEAASGPAVGSYGNVAERAQALVNLAVASARHAPAQIQALQVLAQAAENHAARLAVTLPPGTATSAPAQAMPAPRAAAPSAPARAPRASV
ncbi:hypothetical protein [Streptomyces sp. NPDC048603]|uniref:hypothetical protein n=1 Tax=Streptomyces sp. NPDC048603 TaxID=3365577 RepID=UPI0037136A16